MIFLSFSTGRRQFDVENVLGLMLRSRAAVTATLPRRGFPQLLPHPLNGCGNSVFNRIGTPIDFSTGSTTNTRNMNQRFCVVVVNYRQHSKEVGHAIQR